MAGGSRRRVKIYSLEITLADVGGISPARNEPDWSALPDYSTRRFAHGLPMGPTVLKDSRMDL